MPGAPNVLEQVHRSCAEVAALHGEHITIDADAVAATAAELAAAAEDVRGAVRGLPLPIRFSSPEQELTLLGLYHLLDFGSGYLATPAARRQSGGRTWHESLVFGLLGLHLGGARLDSHKLKSFSMYDIHQVFGLDATVEVPVMPGVTMAKPGPLHPLCKSLLAVLNDTGAQLADSSSKTLGELILNTAGELQKAGRTSASAFVEELVDALPAFRDVVLYDGRTLTLHRRAQNLAADLAAVHGPRDPRFAFPDGDQLAADSGPTTIAVLRAKGVLRLSAELAAAIDGTANDSTADGAAAAPELPAGPHERALRAAAVVACDRIAAASAASTSGSTAPAAAAAEAATAEASATVPAEALGAPPSRAVEVEKEDVAAGGSGAEAVEATSTAEAGGEGGQGAGGSGGGARAAFRAVDVGAYLCYLTEEGREMHGKVSPHSTLGLTAY